jgi:hypothetical protein
VDNSPGGRSPLTADIGTVMLPEGCDPAQILAGGGSTALAEMLGSHTQPLADLVIDTEVRKSNRWLRQPEGQIGALRAAAPLTAAMPPAQLARPNHPSRSPALPRLPDRHRRRH